MQEQDVKIVELEAMHVASALGFGTSPEIQVIEKLTGWLTRRGLMGGAAQPRIFGFNNPNPSLGSPNYGYELWATVGPDVQGDEEITIKDFPGGLYAVLNFRGPGEAIPAAWQALVAWVEASSYRIADNVCLEEHIHIDLQEEDIALGLYLPVRKGE